MLEVRFSDPHSQETCAEVGLNLADASANRCRSERGPHQMLGPTAGLPWPHRLPRLPQA